MNEQTLKRMKQAHEKAQASKRQAEIEHTRSIQQRRLDADERRFLKGMGVEL